MLLRIVSVISLPDVPKHLSCTFCHVMLTQASTMVNYANYYAIFQIFVVVAENRLE